MWEQNGTAYMPMRYYPGHSLRDLRYYAQGSQLFDEASLRYSPAFVAAVNDSLVVKPNERVAEHCCVSRSTRLGQRRKSATAGSVCDPRAGEFGGDGLAVIANNRYADPAARVSHDDD